MNAPIPGFPFALSPVPPSVGAAGSVSGGVNPDPGFPADAGGDVASQPVDFASLVEEEDALAGDVPATDGLLPGLGLTAAVPVYVFDGKRDFSAGDPVVRGASGLPEPASTAVGAADQDGSLIVPETQPLTLPEAHFPGTVVPPDAAAKSDVALSSPLQAPGRLALTAGGAIGSVPVPTRDSGSDGQIVVPHKAAPPTTKGVDAATPSAPQPAPAPSAAPSRPEGPLPAVHPAGQAGAPDAAIALSNLGQASFPGNSSQASIVHFRAVGAPLEPSSVPQPGGVTPGVTTPAVAPPLAPEARPVGAVGSGRPSAAPAPVEWPSLTPHFPSQASPEPAVLPAPSSVPDKEPGNAARIGPAGNREAPRETVMPRTAETALRWSWTAKSDWLAADAAMPAVASPKAEPAGGLIHPAAAGLALPDLPAPPLREAARVAEPGTPVRNVAVAGQAVTRDPAPVAPGPAAPVLPPLATDRDVSVTEPPDDAGPRPVLPLAEPEVASSAMPLTSPAPATPTAVDGLAMGDWKPAADPMSGPAPLRPEPVPAPPSIPAAPAVTQVVQSLAPGRADGVTEIRLSPEELGLVRIDLKTEGDRVVMMISAERQDTSDLLRRHADRLAADLRSAGFQDLDVSFGRWTGTGSGGGDRPQEQPFGAARTPEPASDRIADGHATLPTQLRPLPADRAWSGLYLRL